MKSQRAQLIFSHFLPLLILLPVLGVLLVCVVETQVLLLNLSEDLQHEAIFLAGLASQQGQVLQNPSQAEVFAREAGAEYERNVALYRADGSELVVLIEPAGHPEAAPTADELAALRAGQVRTRTIYTLNPAQDDSEVLTPVFDAQKQLIGIIRISEHIDRLNARLTEVRELILGATALALVVALGISTYIASRTSRRLEVVSAAIANVASGKESVMHLETMPREFRVTLDAVNDLQARLRESEETRKHLLANLVHELGRPLGALQAAIHALQQGADKDPVLRAELEQGMDVQVERLKPLLDNLASLHGGLSGALELHRTPVDLNEWLPKSIVTWRQAAEQKHLNWTQEIPYELPIVSMDADRMGQVIGNLLSNAIKYTPEGGGTIAVRAGQGEGDIWIEVCDSGIGISQEDLAHILYPFYRGHNARFPQGMGLGLAIARDVVNAHDGRIEVESREGEGSVFRVRLPTKELFVK